MTITKETIQHLGRLARIELSEEDVSAFQKELDAVVALFASLDELDTSSTQPCAHPIASWVLSDENGTLRQDIVGDVLDRDVFLKNAPAQQTYGGMIKVPSLTGVSS